VRGQGADSPNPMVLREYSGSIGPPAEPPSVRSPSHRPVRLLAPVQLHVAIVNLFIGVVGLAHLYLRH